MNFTCAQIIDLIKEKPVRSSQSFPASVMKQNYSTEFVGLFEVVLLKHLFKRGQFQTEMSTGHHAAAGRH